MIERILNRLFTRKDIVNCEGDLYLVRWYVVRTERVAVFVHKFVRSDEDRALHDHPWSFLVIPVWRGYWEWNDKRYDPNGPCLGRVRVLPLLGTRYRPAEYRHRVQLVDGRPAWSIFVRFRKRRLGGVWARGRFVDWRKWWNDFCED